jgi:gp16 family phage-associated protein
LALAGTTPAKWADSQGYDQKTVYAVLSGKRRAIRGDSLQIAIKLGLRRDPALPHVNQPLPAGRTVAGGPSVGSCDRRPVLQVGEAAR